LAALRVRPSTRDALVRSSGSLVAKRRVQREQKRGRARCGTMVLHMVGVPNFLPHANEGIAVGDSVFVVKKGVTLECAVTKRQGLRIQLMPEDKSGEIWVSTEEVQKVVPNGAEELMSRAARIAEEKRIEAEKKLKEEMRKQAEAEENSKYKKADDDRKKYIAGEMLRRGVAAREWMPVGSLCWTESPVLMDQTKDCYRIVIYEIDVEKDYGAVRPKPEIDLSSVEELEAEIAQRKKEAEAAKKKAKSKSKKKPTPEEIEAEEAAKKAEDDADAAAVAAMRKECEDVVALKIADYEEEDGKRVKFVPPIYPPENPVTLTPPEHPKNQSLYEELISRKNGHGGDRVFYTDGSWHNNPFSEGSKDGVCKGNGLLKDFAASLGFQCKTLEFTSAYDGGITIKKHDYFPKEDPEEWYYEENDKWSGELRMSEKGKGTEDW